ncbi:thromboxane-A synthase isoform X2 [Conger conger]|nr:thromboxane-A synthase isoform X2 [Conger conger]
MLRQIMVKQFSLFPNRMTIRAATRPMSDCLLMLKDDRWKRVRSVLTPSFSSARMREMVPLIRTATHTLMGNLQDRAQSGESFDIHRCFGCFTMDVIASVAFGTQVDSQKNPDDPFVNHAQKFFSFTFFRPIMFLLIAFPFLIPPLAGLIPNRARDEVNAFFITCIQEIIKQREQQPASERRRDFLQLMLDARGSSEFVGLERFDVVNQADEQPGPSTDPRPAQDPPPRRTQRTPITEDEVVGQAFIFLLAGYETSSNTLAFVCYLLATHPHCQARLQQEVDHFYSRHDSADYHSVQELKYLDMVISEALRLYPPGFRFAREVEQDCMVNGQFLPKGATLEIPAGYLHYDPLHWPEPERFHPERFTEEARSSRHPFVYLPFGAGPRSCVGMRLAQLEIKMALVHIFRRFTVLPCAQTKVPLELKSFTTLGPKNGIFLKITPRDNTELNEPHTDSTDLSEPHTDLNGPYTDLNEPHTDLNEPHTDLNEPHTDLNGPHTDLNGPHTDLNEPHTDLNGPHTDLNEPHTDLNEPHTDLNEPHTDLNGPHTDLNGPHTDLNEPHTDLNEPHTDLNEPHTDLNGPHTDLNEPHTDLNGPHTDLNEPHTDLNGPHTDLNGPHTDLNGPHTDLNEPHTDLNGPHTDLNEPHTDLNGPHTDLNGPHTDLNEPHTDLNEPHTDLNGPHTDRTELLLLNQPQ